MNKAVKKLYITMVVITGALGCWLYGAKLEVVSEASGIIVPITDAARVQHLEGGIIKTVLVDEGQSVAPGQAIFALETTANQAEVEEISGLIGGYKIDIARLEAELRQQKSIKLENALKQQYPKLTKKSQERFRERLSQHKDLLAAQLEKSKQREAEKEEVETRINKNRKNLGLLNEQVEISTALLKEKITNRMNHIQLLREQALVAGGIGEDEAAMVRLRHAINESKIRIKAINNNYREEARKELDSKTQSLNALIERRAEKQDNLRRTVIRAPIGGVIQKMYYSTVGGVISASAVVADIVPEGKKLKVEANLPSQDIGYVRKGQAVQVKLASNDGFRFGKIEGKVSTISPDTVREGDALPHYKVVVDLEKNVFSRGENRYELVPGVQVQCGIIIGERSVLEYVFEPFLNRWKNALTEP